MDDPSWLPDVVKENFRRMVAEGLLSEREQAFFTDSRLDKFWGKVSVYLSSLSDLPAGYLDNAASSLAGAFLVPLAFGYGETGKANNPSSFKKKIRDTQKEADPVIKRVARLAGELADALDELEGVPSCHPELEGLQGIARFLPDGTSLLGIVKQLIDDDALRKLPSYYGRVRTSEALRILEANFRDFPETGELLKDIPGMASQKSTWADWMREAEASLQETLDCWPGTLKLTEADWVNLAQVLIGEHISREVVHAARRG